MRQDCHSCEGIQILTPFEIQNRAGLRELRYSTGTQAAFFESMLARLSELGGIPGGDESNHVSFPTLSHLSGRENDDPTIAMMDAWATVAHILSFYQERIANEAFLSTAVSPVSVEYLSKLVGFTPRPGLSSSVFLAFDVDETSKEVHIPKGTSAKSTPAWELAETAPATRHSADATRPSLPIVRS